MSGSGISRTVCKSAPRSRQINHASTPPLSFLQAGCPSCRPTNSIKALKASITHTQSFNEPLSGTISIGWYQKEHSPTHTHHVRRTSFINFLHLLRPIASSLFNLHAWQSFSTTSLQVLCGLPLGLEASHPIHFFNQSSSPFRNTCPYHCSLSAVVPMLCLLFLIHLWCRGRWGVRSN